MTNTELQAMLSKKSLAKDAEPAVEWLTGYRGALLGTDKIVR